MGAEGGIGWGDSSPCEMAPAGDGGEAPLAAIANPIVEVLVDELTVTSTVDVAANPIVETVVETLPLPVVSRVGSAIVETVVETSPFVRFPPPTPVPGPSGIHDYTVVICDKWGVAKGEILSAVPQEIHWNLDTLDEATIDCWIQDPSLSLLDVANIPGVDEVQIWRDQELIFWGWPTSVSYDATQAHIQCEGLTWVLGQRNFGPGVHQFLANPEFEFGLANWTPVSCFAAAETQTVALGKQAARLVNFASGADAYLEQVLSASAPAAEATFYDLAAWVWIDPRYTFEPAAQNYGLWVGIKIGGVFTDFQVASLDNNISPGQWTRLETGITVPADSTVEMHVRLYSPLGAVVWDACKLTVEESVGSQPEGSDVMQIIKAIMSYVQDPTRGKSDIAFRPGDATTPPFGVIGPSNIGTILQRNYQFADNGVILDALNEFPQIGICDFAMSWDRTGHFRGLQVYAPAKGSLKWNYPVIIDAGSAVTDLQGTIDGSAVATAVRFMGQGSTGPSEDIGYAVFPSKLGGRWTTEAVLEAGSDILTADLDFTTDDIGKGVYSLTPGVIPLGTVITAVPGSGVAVMSNEANLTANPVTVGVDGIILDSVQSAQPDQPISTLQDSAQTWLLESMSAQNVPNPKMRADGPAGYFGMIETGDVLPCRLAYGWLTSDPVLLRVAAICLYPPTEELELTMSQLNSDTVSV